jgi:hypothetical protein
LITKELVKSVLTKCQEGLNLMSSEGFIPEALSAPKLRELVIEALEKAPDDHNPETFHALFDHLERGLSTDDVIHALEGKWEIARHKFNRDAWQYKYEIDGLSIDDEPITIIIAVDTLRKEFTVVTRWRQV